MLKHKVGDTVRIQSQGWIDAQKKDEVGNISFPHADHVLNPGMQKHAGEVVVIERVNSFSYNLRGLRYYWEDWMFDPDYRPEDGPLSARDAIHAMMDGGKTLYDKVGRPFSFNEKTGGFEFVLDSKVVSGWVFGNLSYKLRKISRPMTMQEIAAWVRSADSLGWMVKYKDGWYFPRSVLFLDSLCEYQRARMLSDHSGIDEDTIQGFEVEE